MKLACHPSTAVHPETTTDPATLRWVVSGITLPFAGLLVSAPASTSSSTRYASRRRSAPSWRLFSRAHGNASVPDSGLP